MTYEQFNYWLQGFIEGINNIPTKAQWDKIKEKQAQVFNYTYTTTLPWTSSSTGVVGGNGPSDVGLNGKQILNG